MAQGTTTTKKKRTTTATVRLANPSQITIEVIQFEHPDKHSVREKSIGKSEIASKKKAEEWAIENLKPDYCARVYDKGVLFATYYKVRWERKLYTTVEFAKPVNHKIVTKIWDGKKWMDNIGTPVYEIVVADLDHNVKMVKGDIKTEVQARNVGRKFLLEHKNPDYHATVHEHNYWACWGNGKIIPMSSDKGFMKISNGTVGYFIGNPYPQVSYKTKKKSYKYRRIGTVNGNGQIVKK